MRLQSRVGAVGLAVALSFTGGAAASADETPSAQREGATQQNAAVLHVEGMT